MISRPKHFLHEILKKRLRVPSLKALNYLFFDIVKMKTVLILENA